MEAETVANRAEVEQIKQEQQALENKTQIIEEQLFKEKKYRMRLSTEMTGVWSALHRVSNKTNTDYRNVTERLDRCEAKTSLCMKTMEQRRTQDADVTGEASPVLHFTRSVSFSHISGHVDESNGGHRLLTEGQATADCSSDEISRQLAIINDKFCDEPDEICSNVKVSEQASFTLSGRLRSLRLLAVWLTVVEANGTVKTLYELFVDFGWCVPSINPSGS